MGQILGHPRVPAFWLAIFTGNDHIVVPGCGTGTMVQSAFNPLFISRNFEELHKKERNLHHMFSFPLVTGIHIPGARWDGSPMWSHWRCEATVIFFRWVSQPFSASNDLLRKQICRCLFETSVILCYSSSPRDFCQFLQSADFQGTPVFWETQLQRIGWRRKSKDLPLFDGTFYGFLFNFLQTTQFTPHILTFFWLKSKF